MNFPFIIAEIAQSHDGSIDRAHNYIDALKGTGVDAIKFQVHIADAESSIYEPFRIQINTIDKSRYDYWKRMEFTKEQWQELKEHCENSGFEFIASPFSNTAVNLLEEIGVNKYKVGSGEVTNLLLLQKIAITGKPILLSSGMSSWDEIDQAIQFLEKFNVNLSLMQCTTSYPTKPENYGLNIISEMKNKYTFPIGYSDHSAQIETCIAAITLGAQIVEFHVKLDENQVGPDATSSLTISQTKVLVKSLRNISKAMLHPVDKSKNQQFTELKNIFEKSLALNKSMKAGEYITFNDLEAKKPKGYGIDASRFQDVIGKPLKKDKKQWEFLTLDDLLF